jgi:hypothetical protein
MFIPLLGEYFTYAFVRWQRVSQLCAPNWLWDIFHHNSITNPYYLYRVILHRSLYFAAAAAVLFNAFSSTAMHYHIPPSLPPSLPELTLRCRLRDGSQRSFKAKDTLSDWVPRG